MIVDDGRPVVVTTDNDRIGRGPWARLFATAVVRSEGSEIAERGRTHARAGDVHTVDVDEGAIAAVVEGRDAGHTVTLRVDRVPPRIWAAIAGSHRTGRLEAAIGGREQSLHLEHQMRFDWEEPLVPTGDALRRSCTCPEGPGCEHVAAVGYVVADLIDRDPGLLLRWRGCTTRIADDEEQPEASLVSVDGDPWLAGTLPELREPRPLPAGAVLRSLGESGLRAAGGDLADVLRRAYAAFAKG